MTLLYLIVGAIDYIIYSLAAVIFRIIVNIATVEFFTSNQITDITNRIYVIVGVLMMFKLVITGVQYLINPDILDDKEKGLGGILIRAATSLALLVLVPVLFKFAFTIQKPIIESLPNIVFGTDEGVNFQNDDIGNNLSFRVLKSFIPVRDKWKGKVAEDTTIHDIPSFREHISDGCPTGLGALFGDFTNCHYDYMIIISTACGVFLCYILAAMTLDVATRAIKLGIVEILAPIPIISYVFNKEKLNNFAKTAFSIYLDLFLRMAVIYFVVLTIQQVFDSGVIGRVAPDDNIFARIIATVVIIVALLLFAKNAPKFITDLLGLKDIASDSMKDMFTRAGGLFGSTMAGIRTARSNYTTQKERALGKNPDNKRAAKLRGALSAVAGLGSATGRGIAMATQGKGFKDVRQGASKAAINARNRRIDRADKLYNTSVDKYKEEKEFDKDGNPIMENGQQVTRRIKNPEYYGRLDYLRDVHREKLDIPSNEGFVKLRYDAMEAIAKMAADAKGHGVGKMNETPDKYKINLTLNGGDAGKSISTSLGFEELTMEQVRNMYQMAKNGQEITTAKTDSNGEKIIRKLTDNEITMLGSLVQTIEKRTSYLKEAELMANGDPAAAPNAEKLIIGLQTNKDMFSSKEIRIPIIEKMAKDLKSFQLSGFDDEKSSNYKTIEVDGRKIKMDADNFKYEDLMHITKQLQGSLTEPTAKSEKYNQMRRDGKSEDEITKTLNEDRENYFSTVYKRADILMSIKDAFEEVAKTQYRSAQISDNRSQKAQQAISNNEKKG